MKFYCCIFFFKMYIFFSHIDGILVEVALQLWFIHIWRSLGWKEYYFNCWPTSQILCHCFCSFVVVAAAVVVSTIFQQIVLSSESSDPCDISLLIGNIKDKCEVQEQREIWMKRQKEQWKPSSRKGLQL